jgi:predicted TIM-barrel fold metal-dependent hydrolase
MRYRHDPEGERLPIKIDTTSNGEYAPLPLVDSQEAAIAHAHACVSDNARRRGVGRRDFMISTCGAATTLLALNEAHAAQGRTGGYFDLPKLAGVDQQMAAATLEGSEFIFDVQNHHVNAIGRWRNPQSPWMRGLKNFPNSACKHEIGAGEYNYVNCFNGENYIKDVFMDSDTQLAVMSMVPSTFEDAPLTIEEADATRALVEKLGRGQRMFLHGKVNPNLPGDMERMEELKNKWGVIAWKSYTQWGPDGKGYFLDDEKYGIPFIEKARALGIKIICIHKGLPFGKESYEHSTCRDIGVVARKYPDMTFMLYHSGYDMSLTEGPYNPANAGAGVDALVKSLLDNGVKPNSNVYCELGSTWRILMTRDPAQGAHVWGKLLKYVGENNVMWGTDCIWYGSPQDQIQAFRAFQISDELQQKHGYPKLTAALKAKIFGANAAKIYGVDVPAQRKRAAADALSREKQAYLEERRDPSFVTYGPKTRREFFAFRREHNGKPW